MLVTLKTWAPLVRFSIRSDHSNSPNPTVNQQLTGVQTRHHHISAATTKPIRTAVKNNPFRNSPTGSQANIVAGVSLRGPIENSIGNNATRITTTNKIRTEITPYLKWARSSNQVDQPVGNDSRSVKAESVCLLEAITQQSFHLNLNLNLNL